jgi:HEAT repeat protein
MSQSDRAERALSADDSLPPVEPPSAGFILQLFVVPGMIVLIIVMVWLMFNWLARPEADPESYVRALGRDNEARWQAANNLANALTSERSKGQQTLATDAGLVRRLSRILEGEIDAGSMEDKSITFRTYLCRAVGEFSVPDGLPVLLKAANTSRNENEVWVRLAALEAIALLVENVRAVDPAHPLDNAQFDETLLKAADDDDSRVRTRAAVGLGVVGSPELLARLRQMLADGYPDVRYGAATRLAVRADATAQEVLVEMLDPDQRAGIDVEKEEASRDQKRASILINALRAAQQLSAANRTADLDPLKRAIEKLLSAKIGAEIRVEATAVLRDLSARALPAETPGK